MCKCLDDSIEVLSTKKWNVSIGKVQKMGSSPNAENVFLGYGIIIVGEYGKVKAHTFKYCPVCGVKIDI